MEFKKKENKLKITGRAAAVDETKTAAEQLRQTLVVAQHEVCRPGKCCGLFLYLEFSYLFSFASLDLFGVIATT